MRKVVVPEMPQFTTAFGAALMAKENFLGVKYGKVMEKLRYLTGFVGCLMTSNIFIGCSACPSCFGCAGFGIGMAVFSFIKRGSCKSRHSRENGNPDLSLRKQGTEGTGFPRIKCGAGSVKHGMTKGAGMQEVNNGMA